MTMRTRIQAMLQRGIAVDLLIGLTLKGFGAAASFGLNLLISRALGAEGVGTYQIALSTAALLAVASCMGLDTVVLRSVAIARRTGDLGAAKVAIGKAVSVVAGLGLAFGLAMAALSYPLTHWAMGRPSLFLPMLIMAAAVPTVALVRTISASIRATGSVLLSQSLDGISYTGLTVAILALLWLATGSVPGLAPEVVYASASTVVAAFALFKIRAMTRTWPQGTQTVSLKSGLRIAVIYLAAYLCDWIAVVTLGAWHGPAEAGIYRVAVQFGLLFTLVRNSFDQMVGSHIAARYADKDYKGMLRIAQKTGLAGGLLCLPLLIAILVFPQFLLGLFGPDFVRGASALMILAIGQFIAVTVGPIGTVLDMSHREHIAMRIEIAVSVLTIALFFALVPWLDLLGAAIALTSATVCRAAALLVANQVFMRATSK